MDDDTIIIASTFLILEEEVADNNAKKRRKQKEHWVRPFLLEGNGVYVSFRERLKRNDPDLYKNFVRMSPDDFDYLLNLVTPSIEKANTNMRESICPGERLAITLRFLATGDSYASLMFLFKRSRSSICNIVPEVCTALYKVLKDEFLKVKPNLLHKKTYQKQYLLIQMPATEEEWESISQSINKTWNFPNSIGALDGKHIDIIAPAHCGSAYFNYKKKNSIVLMALVDANYNFVYIDVGAKGRESDGGVFSRCSLSNGLCNNTLNLPQPKPLPCRQKPIPYVIVADDAFPLNSNIMKPYSFRNQNTKERIFNYRLSRFRRVSENVFGLISARFRVVRKTMELSPPNVVKVVLAVCALHNFLNKRKCGTYAQTRDYDQVNADGSITDGRWREEVRTENILSSIEPLCNQGRQSETSKLIRQEFTEYFLNEGEVPWQYKHIY